MKFMKKMLLILISLFLIVAGCQEGTSSSKPQEITVLTHDSFSAGKEVIALFEKENHAKVKFLKAGDAGAALNQAILTKKNPMADVFYGVDNSFLSRALQADIFEPYASPLLENIADELKLDPQNRLLPVDFGDVCLNYDKKWFEQKGMAPPGSLEDLIKPDYKGLTVVENPATSSPGLAFLLATVKRFGDPGYLDFWKKMRANDVLVMDGWESAYWGEFSAASQGDRPIVVSYAGSPAAEVHFSEKPLQESPTAAVLSEGSVFRQIEFVGILKGTRKRKLAEKLVDFFLDRFFQEDIPLQMFVFPANASANLPEVFVRHARIADYSQQIPYADIAANREKWIENWTNVVLR